MSSPASPSYRFKEDPVQTLIKSVLSKKPVNSDHYSLVKRIKLSDYAGRGVAKENLDNVAKRSKEYMAEVGFAYGRLLEKDWTPSEIKDTKLRIHAPGPVIYTNFNEEEDLNFDIPDSFKTKKLVGFREVRHTDLLNKRQPASTPKNFSSTRPATQLSASQRQAREYLNYLNALSGGEHELINNQVSQKRKELNQRLKEKAKITEKEMNEKGIFSPAFNKERVASMFPVKMLSKNKVCIEPMIRNAKDIVMKEKVKELQQESFEFRKNKSDSIDKAPKKDRLIDVMQATITKKHVKSKIKEVSSFEKKKVKMDWSDRLNFTMDDIREKTRLDEKLILS